MAKNFDSNDLKENSIYGGLGYVLFFLPLITRPKSEYGRYCANQGLIILIAQLVILIAFAILDAVVGWVPIVGWIIDVARKILHTVLALVTLYLTYLACFKSDAREVPYFGKYNIIK